MKMKKSLVFLIGVIAGVSGYFLFDWWRASGLRISDDEERFFNSFRSTILGIDLDLYERIWDGKKELFDDEALSRALLAALHQEYRQCIWYERCLDHHKTPNVLLSCVLHKFIFACSGVSNSAKIREKSLENLRKYEMASMSGDWISTTNRVLDGQKRAVGQMFRRLEPYQEYGKAAIREIHEQLQQGVDCCDVTVLSPIEFRQAGILSATENAIRPIDGTVPVELKTRTDEIVFGNDLAHNKMQRTE